jgi:hypothetical protein
VRTPPPVSGRSHSTPRREFEKVMEATRKELRDIKSALDEHSIVAITDARWGSLGVVVLTESGCASDGSTCQIRTETSR